MSVYEMFHEYPKSKWSVSVEVDYLYDKKKVIRCKCRNWFGCMMNKCDKV